MAFKTTTGPIDCACVIHGDGYAWGYVERLYNMLARNITPGIRFHVYTEADRSVPAHMIKHELVDWGIGGPKKSWWYKMQLFNPEHHAGPLLYFDLDVVVVKNIDWIWQQNLRYFWTVRDFKHLWRPTRYDINSSVMWWDTRDFVDVWTGFCNKKIIEVTAQFPGDQDYLTAAIADTRRRFFDINRVRSWRWEVLDGGYDFRRRCYRKPSSGPEITDQDSVVVFHGKPKPENVSDSFIIQHWR